MTAYEDAVQAAAEALWVTEHFPVDENDVRLPSADHPNFVQMEVMTYPSADAAVAAALPHLAEQFARLVEADCVDSGCADDVCEYRRAARLIRAATNPEVSS